MRLISRATSFLYSIKSIDVDKLRPDAVMPEFANDVLKERGLKAPIGEVKALPASNFKGSPDVVRSSRARGRLLSASLYRCRSAVHRTTALRMQRPPLLPASRYS